MNLQEFLAKYGTHTASLLIERGAEIIRQQANGHSKVAAGLDELASDLCEALKSTPRIKP